MTTVKEAWNMCCPNCDKDEALSVTVTTEALLTPDGTDIDEGASGDHEWDDDSVCQCMGCGHAATAGEFATT